MVNFPSFTAFSGAVHALRSESTQVRLSLRYGGAGVGTAYGHLVAKVTDDTTTLTFRTDSKADLKDLDALALWLLITHVQPDSADQVAVAEAAVAVPPRVPLPHPKGSGAQRRSATRARAAASGIPKTLSVKYRLKLRRQEARSERKGKLRANIGHISCRVLKS